MSVVFALVGLMLLGAAALTVLRMVRGPATLDRVVANDMLVAIMLCGLATYAAATRDSSVVPAVLVLALLGFVGSVSVARFLGRGPVEGGDR
jgi:multicomponent Na+:H+ antiporter subunit F